MGWEKRGFFVLAAACLALCAGCGKDGRLTAFHEEMDLFYDGLTDSVSALEAIEPSDENAGEAVQEQLEEMSGLFDQLAAIEVPPKMEERVGNVDELADEAAAYMEEASRLYRIALEDGGAGGPALNAARENYTRAMEQVNYIAVLLQGRIPEGEGVTVIAEEETAVSSS